MRRVETQLQVCVTEFVHRRAGDHSLAQGLKGDATYLVVSDKGVLENYAINGASALRRHRRCEA